MSPFVKKWIERVAWTAAEVGAAWVGAHAGLFPEEYIPLVTVLAAMVKNTAAKHVGDKTDPGLPSVK